MKATTFYSQLLLVTAPLIALTLVLSSIYPPFEAYAPMTWASIFFFTAFSWVIYIVGKKSAKSENKNDFTQFSMMVIMGKLFFSLILVVGYVYIAKPTSRFVVLPFIPIYIIYSVFETNFLMILSKGEKKVPTEKKQ